MAKPGSPEIVTVSREILYDHLRAWLSARTRHSDSAPQTVAEAENEDGQEQGQTQGQTQEEGSK
jgi:hypothetical protein